MQILFTGATGIVPGSHYVLQINGRNYVLDMGGIPGRRNKSLFERTLSSVYPLAPDISAVFISHGHFDHFKKVQKFVEDFGYRGPIFATHGTVEVMKTNGKPKKRNFTSINDIVEQIHHASVSSSLSSSLSSPLLSYLQLKPTRFDAYDAFSQRSLEERLQIVKSWKGWVDPQIQKYTDLIVPRAFYDSLTFPGVKFTFLKSSHILGSAQILIEANEKGRKKRVLYTGDIAAANSLFDAPDIPRAIDLVIFDTTNGDKQKRQAYSVKEQIKHIILDTVGRGGQAYFATFTVNRLQLVMHYIKQLWDEGAIPRDIGYYVNTPTGKKMIDLYRQFPYSFRSEVKEKLLAAQNGDAYYDPFLISSDFLIGRNTKRSQKHITDDRPYVVLSASGMFTEGRILRYLMKQGKNRGIEDPRNSIVICGYQAESLGKILLEAYEHPSSHKTIHLNGKSYSLRAKVYKLENLSGHMYQDEALDFLRELQPRMIALVHAEESTRQQFARYLKEHHLKAQIFLPEYLDVITL